MCNNTDSRKAVGKVSDSADLAMPSSNEKKICDSWVQNAAAWTTAVREHQIESRRLVTNQAIIDTVVHCSPQTVLDVGCGEGWLVRALFSHGIKACGIDGSAALIAQARSMGGGTFKVVPYAEITAGMLNKRFDVVVCNFSLLGHESVTRLIEQIPGLLSSGGDFIIQTLHPLMNCGDRSYDNGWRSGSWAGFSQDFVDPAPWYFRTMAGWVQLLAQKGLTLTQLVEPLHPQTGKPASVIFVSEVADRA